MPGVLRWCVAACAAVLAGAVARRAGSGSLQPAERLAWMRVLNTFLHVSACPDVLLCTDCVLVGLCDGHWLVCWGGLGVAS